VLTDTSTTSKPPPAIQHPEYVKSILPLLLTDLAEPYLFTGSGDTIRVYDVSALEEPELIREVEGHWREVTAIRLWFRKSAGDNGKSYVEPWIVSASLDNTIRKWRLNGRLIFSFLFLDALNLTFIRHADSSGYVPCDHRTSEDCRHNDFFVSDIGRGRP
jgi:WD40 repeat protein